MAKVIGIISIKGGVGKTTTVTNIGASLAKMGQRVLMIDANYSAPNLGLHFGLVKPDAATIHEVLTNRASIRNATYEHEAGFHFVPGALIPRASDRIDIFRLRSKIKEVKDDYDVILIDSSPTLNAEMLSAMIASDELLVVTTPDYPTLSCTMRAIKLAKQKKTPITGLILNKIRNQKFEISLKDIEETTGVPVLAVLPDETDVLAALSETTPVTIHSPTSKVSIEYKKLAASLVGAEFRERNIWNKIKGMFGGLDKQDINRAVVCRRNQ
jgi:septum site-determining protein MinD